MFGSLDGGRHSRVSLNYIKQLDYLTLCGFMKTITNIYDMTEAYSFYKEHAIDIVNA